MLKILGPDGKPLPSSEPTAEIVQLRKQILAQLKKNQALQARFDAAQRSTTSAQHWAMADHFSPNATAGLRVRKELREKSRYETDNNGYLKGILLTLGMDMVGSGPSLQITDARFNQQQSRAIERRWKQRAKKIRLRRKLFGLRYARTQDGEGFAFAFNNQRLKHPVKLDQRVIECDQVSNFESPLNDGIQRNQVDGVRIDPRSGDASSYYLLNEHPGENFALFSPTNLPNDGRWIDADNVIHWFRRERQWVRGIPETASTLNLWALLRRYTKAVVQNAEIAASFVAILKTIQAATSNPFTGTANNEDSWFDEWPVTSGMLVSAPDGYDIEQMKPEQPVTVYDVFVDALIREAARPLMMPLNRSTGFSGRYNMASGTTDMQAYKGFMDYDRFDCEEEVLDLDLEQWWFEAIRIPNYFEVLDTQASDQEEPLLVEDVRSVVDRFASLREEPPEHSYRWDNIPVHHDPVKVATATKILLDSAVISDTDVQEGQHNRPTEEHYANLQRQNQFRNENGFPLQPALGIMQLSEAPDDEEGEFS